MADLYPLRLERHLSGRLWGGGRLERFLDLPEPWRGDEPLGEAWQVYAGNRVLNGPLAGRSLAELARDYGAELLGSLNMTRYGRRVPLLAKFIDAADRLSIQVHPDDTYAKEHEAHTGHLGKTEAWYILDAEPGAAIIWGFREQLSREEVRRAVQEGRLEPHLNRVPVSAGDVVYNPAGTVHAIGAGIFLFEIQQSSDLTYRLYDYGRRDASGQLRELHVDKALDVAELRPGQHPKVTPRPLTDAKTELLRTPHFVMERWQVSGSRTEEVSPVSFEVLTVTEGDVALRDRELELRLKRGDSIVLPACMNRYTLGGRATLLRCYVAAARPDSSVSE